MLAILAAVALAFGAQFQNQAVGKSTEKTPRRRGSLSLKELGRLFVRPRWMTGLGLMGVGMVLQVAALTLAPLIVVQPIGAIALVITSLLNARSTKTKLNRGTILAIGLSTFGVGGFVITASQVARLKACPTSAALRQVGGVAGGPVRQICKVLGHTHVNRMHFSRVVRDLRRGYGYH